jgi:hypothetical protein
MSALMRGAPAVLLYLGIGALCHAVFIGAQFDWSSAWTWGVLFGWPMAMLGAMFALAVLVGVGVLLVAAFNDARRILQRRRRRPGGRH